LHRQHRVFLQHEPLRGDEPQPRHHGLGISQAVAKFFFFCRRLNRSRRQETARTRRVVDVDGAGCGSDDVHDTHVAARAVGGACARC
jgi:hypothetical protein